MNGGGTSFLERPKPKVIRKVATSHKTVRKPIGPLTGIKYRVAGFPLDSMATRVVNRAYQLRGIDRSLTLKGENGSFQIDKQSECYSDGIRERSRGYCQLSEKYHAPFIWNTGYTYNYKLKRYIVNYKLAEAGGHTTGFMDWEIQLNYCTEVRDDAWQKGTMPFNAYFVRNHYKNDLIKI